MQRLHVDWIWVMCLLPALMLHGVVDVYVLLVLLLLSGVVGGLNLVMVRLLLCGDLALDLMLMVIVDGLGSARGAVRVVTGRS